MDNKELMEQIASNAQEVAEIESKISAAIVGFQIELETRNKAGAELKEQVKVAMRDSGTKKLENEVLSITYTAPTTRTAIDTTRLKVEKPELWEEYSKTSDVKDYVKIKINNKI